MSDTMLRSAESDLRPSAMPIPEHVPPELVIDPTPYLARLNTEVDPYSMTKNMLENVPPLFYSDKLQGGGVFDSAWVVTRFKDIAEVLQNEDNYSVREGVVLHRLVGETFPMIPLTVDPPDHAKYRMFLYPWLAPKTIRNMDKRIRAAVSDLIDGFADKGECDAAHDFGRVFPVRIFLDLMGFPQEMLDSFLSWEYAILHAQGDLERVRWGMSSALAWLRGFIAETKTCPADHLTSYIVHGEIDGEPLTDDEIIGMVAFLWIAGLDTVAATTAMAFRRLALQPDLQRRLRESPELIPAAVDEILRMQPVINNPRTVKRDHELHGVSLKKGDRIVCFAAVGNFDPKEFADPWTFRLDRGSNRHFTLGGGPYICLGMHLARRELHIALSEFLRRIPQFSMKPAANLEVYPGLIAVAHVPVVWDADGAAHPDEG